MKDIYRNPIFYYILIPIAALLWPLLVWGVYLPRTEKNSKAETKHYQEAEQVMEQILELDRERLELADANTGQTTFDYAIAIDKVAGSCGISSANYTNYKLSSRPSRVKRKTGEKTKNANVTLERVDITRFAKFLSTLQLRWAGLRCEEVKLTKRKDLKDAWKADLKFRYYY